MKQLLLRVDDSIHAQLSERAKREHRSVNALAGEILAVAADVDPQSVRDRTRARAAALGMLARRPTRPHSDKYTADERDRIIASTRGIGEIADAVLDADRGRL